MEKIKNLIRDVRDFPKEGIIFKDLTPVIADHEALSAIIDKLSEHVRRVGANKIVAADARGFLFGTPVALATKVSLHLARKKGKLPWDTISHHYDLEYGSNCLEMHCDAIQQGDRVIVIDDLLATGGTVEAINTLIRKMGGEVVANCFVVELSFLKGRDKLNTEVISLAEYD